jgi:solute carrier family 25 carnitine/acylcarnitine transporter 20/29
MPLEPKKHIPCTYDLDGLALNNRVGETTGLCRVEYEYKNNRLVPLNSTCEKTEIIKQSNFTANIIGGMTHATLVTAVGYPFDLVKARLQTKMYSNSWSCITSTIKNEGFLGLYRGSLMPWISHMLKRPMQFPISEYLKIRADEASNNNKIYNYAIGGITGFPGSIVGNPLQVIKVRVQTSNKANSWHYIKDIYNKNGIGGFYRGIIPTATKDCIYGASFVGNYYTFRDYLGNDKWYKNFVSGAAAHSLTWCIFIPIDYVKTIIQKSDDKIKPKIRTVILNSYKEHGITIFWRGVIPMCIRTVPVSGIGMVGYEHVRQLFIK